MSDQLEIPNFITQVQKAQQTQEQELDYNGGISARREKNEDLPTPYNPPQPSLLQRLFCCFTGNVEYPMHELTPIPVGSPDALLPEQAAEHRGKICLVLDLDETLVHSSFKPVPNADFVIPVEMDDNTYNVYVAKRPGVDDFMREVGKHFEVVVFTASIAKYADPVLDLLDIHKVVKWRLFRDACTFSRGSYVKDLARIGRVLKHTLIIDNSEASFIFQPEYAILIGTWFDDPSDRELPEMLPFLIHLSKCDDVKEPLRLWKNGQRKFP